MQQKREDDGLERKEDLQVEGRTKNCKLRKSTQSGRNSALPHSAPTYGLRTT